MHNAVPQVSHLESALGLTGTAIGLVLFMRALLHGSGALAVRRNTQVPQEASLVRRASEVDEVIERPRVGFPGRSKHGPLV
jgi:hypothetical protein